MVPERWRHWWLGSVVDIPELSTVTLHDLKSVVTDVTVECDLIGSCLKHNKLGELKKVIDDHFYLTIKCPWGCTEFHIHGKIPFDIIMYRILG
jgi:hypothetical protein